MKKYILTEKERDEIFDYLRMRSTLAARNTLLQLPEVQDKEKFVEHIRKHLEKDEEVICKICKKTAREIIESENSE